jgi:hypothetical protein
VNKYVWVNMHRMKMKFRSDLSTESIGLENVASCRRVEEFGVGM